MPQDRAKPPPAPAFLTVAELAARWKVSERTVRRMVERGSLRGIRIGPQLRILIEAIERYEARHAEGNIDL